MNLPLFAKTLGLDLIIRPDGGVVLIELQNHFGRSGLMRLHPDVSRRHRQCSRKLRDLYGRYPALYRKFGAVCSNKIETYRRLSRYQPRSRSCHRWTPAVASWVSGLSSKHIIIKPPRGSCGRGIRVVPRHDLGPDDFSPSLPGPLLLQEYTESRRLTGPDGLLHMGCIRHILHFFSDGRRIGFVHLPSYWRVAPEPYTTSPVREAFTANISRGAFPLPVNSDDGRAVRSRAEDVVLDLTGSLLAAGRLSRGSSTRITSGGELREDRTGQVDKPPGVR